MCSLVVALNKNEQQKTFCSISKECRGEHIFSALSREYISHKCTVKVPFYLNQMSSFWYLIKPFEVQICSKDSGGKHTYSGTVLQSKVIKYSLSTAAKDLEMDLEMTFI